MGKKSKRRNGRCVYCLEYSDTITDDHFIPRSWYPADSPDNLIKPTAPCCYKCNQSLGKHEKEIGTMMWMCIDPSKPGAKGLRDKVFRSFGVGVHNLKKKEREHRNAFMRRILKMMKPVPKSGLSPFPGFGPHNNEPIEKHRYVPIDQEGIKLLAKKVITGLEYRQGGKERYIEEPHVLNIYFPNEEGLGEALDIFLKLPVYEHGTGFEIRRGASEDGRTILYRVKLWNTWLIYAVITDNEKYKSKD